MQLSPGSTLLHYRLVEQIGEGGMGAVWRAIDTTLDREVALKVLPPAFAGDAERSARFEREAKVLGSLNHPNVATLYGLESVSTHMAAGTAAPQWTQVEEEGFVAHASRVQAADFESTPSAGSSLGPQAPSQTVFLVMELVEGEGLDQLIARGPVAAAEAVPIAIQIALGLEAAHDRGIVHRNLKPANVMIPPFA